MQVIDKLSKMFRGYYPDFIGESYFSSFEGRLFTYIIKDALYTGAISKVDFYIDEGKYNVWVDFMYKGGVGKYNGGIIKDEFVYKGVKDSTYKEFTDLDEAIIYFEMLVNYCVFKNKGYFTYAELYTELEQYGFKKSNYTIDGLATYTYKEDMDDLYSLVVGVTDTGDLVLEEHYEDQLCRKKIEHKINLTHNYTKGFIGQYIEGFKKRRELLNQAYSTIQIILGNTIDTINDSLTHFEE